MQPTCLLIDNDVLLKLARYGLLGHLSSEGIAAGVLGAARFVVHGHLRDHPTAQAGFAVFLSRAIEMEPTASELVRASAIQDVAVSGAMPLDGGESQLIVMSGRDAGCLLVTGDKRAISAADSLIGAFAEIGALEGRVVCLEQLVVEIVRTTPASMKADICGAADADRTMSICFSCATSVNSREQQIECLESHVASLRVEAPRLLYHDADLVLT